MYLNYALIRDPSSDCIIYKYNIIIMLHYLLVSMKYMYKPYENNSVSWLFRVNRKRPR